jgi:hypothetical protein
MAVNIIIPVMISILVELICRSQASYLMVYAEKNKRYPLITTWNPGSSENPSEAWKLLPNRICSEKWDAIGKSAASTGPPENLGRFRVAD